MMMQARGAYMRRLMSSPSSSLPSVRFNGQILSKAAADGLAKPLSETEPLVIESVGSNRPPLPPGPSGQAAAQTATTSQSRWILLGSASTLLYLAFMMATQSYHMDQALLAARGDVDALQHHLSFLQQRIDALERMVLVRDQRAELAPANSTSA
jgi:hypothetical protein